MNPLADLIYSPLVPLAATFLIGALLGVLLHWWIGHQKIRQVQESIAARYDIDLAVMRERVATLDNQLTQAQDNLQQSQEKYQQLWEAKSDLEKSQAALETRIDAERKKHEETLRLIATAQQELTDAFKALAAEALASNNQSFLQLAKAVLEKFHQQAQSDLESRQKAIDGLVLPLKESLQQVDHKLQNLEKERLQAYAGLLEQVKLLSTAHTDLRAETAKLVNALKTPAVRGRWGEIQLRRVVEIAGMTPHVDFVEQASADTDAGKLRPDLIVHLPGRKNIVIDAKAPLQAYLNAAEDQADDQRQSWMKHHARLIREHISRLSSKNYWEQFHPTPEFVVMFLPGEMFFSAALEQQPDLIETGMSQRVIPASPTTLIALLRAVAYGWRQEQLAENAQEISNLGKQLYERLRTFIDYLDRLGGGLKTAIDSYNRAVGSFENRVLVTARKFPELGVVAGTELGVLNPVEKSPRQVSASEAAE